MNKIVKEQLDSCNYAKLENFDSTTNTYFIPKYTKPQFKVGKCYLVAVSKAIVKNSNSVMATNWNNGHAPQEEYLKIYISKSMGTNIYVDSIGYDYDNSIDTAYLWSGWLNVGDLSLLKEIL